MKRLFFLWLALAACWGQEVAITTASGNQFAPQVAAGHDCFFVVWEDYRAGVTNANIYGQSVFPDGSVGGVGYAICTAPASNQTAPVVAYDAAEGDFLVLWFDQRSGSQLYARRATCSGASGDEWLVDDVTASFSAPAFALGPDGGILVWMARSGAAFTVNYIVIDASGAPTGDMVELSPTGKSPDIAFGGDVFFVVWEDSTDAGKGIYGRFLSGSDGSPLTEQFLLVDDGAASAPAVCSYSVGGEARFAVVWQHYDAATDADIYFATTEALSTAPVVGVSVCTEEQAQSAPDVAAHEAGFLVVWQDQRPIYQSDIYGRFLSLAGTPLGADFAVCDASMSQLVPQVSFGQELDRYFVVWVDQRSGATSDIYGALVEPPTVVEGPSVTNVEPVEGTISGCDSAMVISIMSSAPLDTTSILLTLNGDTFSIASDHVWTDGDMTIFFHPDYPAGACETLEVCLIALSDVDGRGLESPFCWSWVWDDAAPVVSTTSPSYGDVLDEMPSTITASISDDPAGVDEASIGATINGAAFSPADDGVYWDGYTLTLNLTELGYSALPETNVVVFSFGDAALCPNWGEDTLVFYLISNPGPVASAQMPLPGTVTSCADQEIQLSLLDDDGVDETSIVLVVDSVEYAYPDHMSFIPPSTLIFTPSPAFDEGEVTVELVSARDVLGHDLASPLEFSFFVDLTPPVVSSATYPPGAVIDTLSSDDLVITAVDNFCDSLAFESCYVTLSTCGGELIARWEGDSLERPDSLSISVPAGSFLQALAGAASGAVDSFVICAHIADAPDYCYPNVTDTCWMVYYHGTGVSDFRRPDVVSLSVSPNPFNAAVLITYEAPAGGRLELIGQDGRVIARWGVSGSGQLLWDGSAADGTPLPAGRYWLVLRVRGGTVARALDIVR